MYVRNLLNSILDFPGSQCSEATTGEIYFLVLDSTHKAALWIIWKALRDLLWQPYDTEKY